MIKFIFKNFSFFIFSSIFTAGYSFAQEKATTNNIDPVYFVTIQAVFLILVFFGYPLMIFCKCKMNNTNQAPLKGLNLPQGSVRSMIAIAIIGSFLITLSLGPLAITEKQLNVVFAAFGSLSGAIIGFYFGSGGSGGNNKTKNIETGNK